jgi:phage gp36-like protein
VPYVTQTELEQRAAGLKAWTDDDAVGAIDADIVAEAIDNASAEIDAATGQHYATPLGLSDPATARIVKDRTGAIAVYKLASRVGAVDENIRLQYEDAL